MINLLQVPGGIESQQVMLQVRFAEVNRSALTEAGVSLFTGARRQGLGRAASTTQQFAAPDFDTGNGETSADVQRFPEPVRLQPKYGIGARASRRSDRRAASRASPSRT